MRMKTQIVWLFLLLIIIIPNAFGMDSLYDGLLFIDRGQIHEARQIVYEFSFNENYNDALTLLNTILEKYPFSRDRVNVMIQKATIYEKMKQFKDAITQYEAIMTLDPSTYDDHPYYSYAQFSQLRIDYLTSKPTWARQSREVLFTELKSAFSTFDQEQIRFLLKKGDCYIGTMFSEPFLTNSDDLYLYLKAAYKNSNLSVKEPVEIWEDQWALEINNWKDSHYPDFDLLYLLIKEGLFGWEWGEIIFSKSEWMKE